MHGRSIHADPYQNEYDVGWQTLISRQSKARVNMVSHMVDRTDTSAFGQASGLQIETNKAQIQQLPDDTVEKRYLTSNAIQRARQDERSLTYLQTHFGEVHMGGWRYFTPKFYGLGADETSYTMECVSGVPVAELPRDQVTDAEYRSGIWLALYHDRIFGADQWGYVFSDFNVHNILIDFSKNQIAAVDPGTAWGQNSIIQEDVVHHVHSLLAVLILNGRAPFKSLFRFLDGYLETRPASITWRSYVRGFTRDYRRKFRRFGKKSVTSRLIFYSTLILLLPIHFVLVPGYARLRRSGKR